MGTLNTCSRKVKRELGGAKYIHKLREIGRKGGRVVKEGVGERGREDIRSDSRSTWGKGRDQVGGEGRSEKDKTPPATLTTSEWCSPSSRPLYCSMKAMREVVT